MPQTTEKNLNGYQSVKPQSGTATPTQLIRMRCEEDPRRLRCMWQKV